MVIELKLQELTAILSNDLTLQQRGVLVTLLLVKESDPELSGAKFKAKVKLTKAVKEDLIYLHKKGFIDVSEIEKLEESVKDSVSPMVNKIIDFMNATWGSSYKATTKSTVSTISARLAEYSVEEIKLVISNRYKEWKGTEMEKYLTPGTVFRPSKFEKYLQEANRTKIGMSIVEADKFNIKKGDVITIDNINQLTDSEVYVIRCCSVDPVSGKLKNIGSRTEGLKGVNVKKNIELLEASKARGFEPEFGYLYWGE